VHLSILTSEVACGPNADTFSSYLDVVARERLSILTNSWDHVSKFRLKHALGGFPGNVYIIIVIIYCFLILID